MSEVGYWGIPGTSRTTKVHIRNYGNRTMCGYTFTKRYEYQFCARFVDAFSLKMVECDRCKERWLQYMKKEAKILEKVAKSRNMVTIARDRKEAHVVADAYLNLKRCIGGHIIADGLMCPHCDCYNPEDECPKERIKR